MSWRNRLAIAILGIGAALSALWAYVGIRGVLRMLHEAGGPFGSSNAFGFLEYVLPLFVTFWLSGQVRQRGRNGRWLSRAYLFATLILLTIFATFLSQLFLRSEIFGHGLFAEVVLVGSFIAGAVWLPVQAFFAAGFLGLLIKGRTPSA